MALPLIGLVGESPHDTRAIRNLLRQRYPSTRFRIEELISNVDAEQLRGSLLDEPKGKFRHILRKEYEFRKPTCSIFIRDLDALKTDRKALGDKRKLFTKFKSIVDKKAIFLLNIYEIEALILSDIEAYNLYMKTEVPPVSNPMLQVKPKEYLQDHSKYIEARSPKILERLRIDTVISNCQYFSQFIKDLDKKLDSKP